MQFMDVGQGDAIYIEFPDGTNMLVDFGSTKNKTLTGEDALAYFQKHTRFANTGQTLDYLVLTHGDRDHYNNIRVFLDTLQPVIKNLLFGGNESDYSGLVTYLRNRHKFIGGSAINVLVPPSTGPFNLGTFGGAQVRVLAVNAPAVSASSPAWVKNTSSVVLQVAFANRRVILSGDATIDTEQLILTTFKNAGQLASLQSGALKVGHHGSARTSIRPAWIKAVSPAWVFIPSDRSGTLGDGEKSTGHRLPQELAIDIIRGNTTLGGSGKHGYFSAYDEGDYIGYVNPDTGGKGLVPPRSGRAWMNPSTTEAIFTSLSTLDSRLPDGTLADQGVQYGMRIRSDEFVELLVTEP